MRINDHTTASRAAAAVAQTLAAFQLLWAGFGAESGLAVGTSAFLGLGTLAAAVGLARSGAFEARMAVLVAVATQLALMLLAVALGLPGQSRHPVDPQAVLALALPLTVVALLVLDHATRRTAADRTPPSYAL